MTPAAIAELQKPLDKKAVQPAKQYGPKGDYIEGWHAIAEANRIFGHDAWSYHVVDCHVVAEKPREIGRDKKPGFGVTYIATVRVVVDGVTREDVGSGHGYDIDLGLAHESAIKEAITDALKRALRTFGWPFGLALYDKSRENVASEPAGNPASRGAGAVSPSAAPAPAITQDQATFIDGSKRALALAESVTDVAEWEERNKPEAARLGFRRDNPAGVALRKAINDRIAEIELADLPAGQLEAAE